MTESEAIKELKEALDCCTSGEDEHFKEALGMGILAIEEIYQYRAIGTVDELKALKEKAEPKKVMGLYHNVCPSCSWVVSHNNKYCERCGQKLDWE